MNQRTALAPGLALLFTLGACQSGGSMETSVDHWNVDGVPERVVRHFTGYRRDLHGSFLDYQAQKKKHINLTLRRHVLNNNPANPFQPNDRELGATRRNHSILPDFLNYFHLESIVIGSALNAWQGAFLPVPLESVIATVATAEGRSEFVSGLTDTFSGKWRSRKQEPPRPSQFRVHNR